MLEEMKIARHELESATKDMEEDLRGTMTLVPEAQERADDLTRQSDELEE